MSKLSREMTTLAKQAGGSYKTVHDRIRIMDRLCRHLLGLRSQEAVQCASSLKTWEKQLGRHQQLFQDVPQYLIHGVVLVTDHTVAAYPQKHIPQALAGMTQAVTQIHVQ
ncbi:phage integrase N-terminal domain-containing protein [Brenneria alni]|uniref:phage integrase N-terminal domain-containing protein n=1 Tax=Brenneria alni TaxID=71656 RepID=UPI0023E7F13D|nr:phage integrase N-terminal domain-containing protein [Brenneria alni]